MQKLKTTLLSSWQNTSHINVLLKCATNPRADQGGIEEVPCQNCLVMSRGTKGCKMAILRPYLPQYAAVFGVFLFQLPSPARSIFSLRSQGGSSRFHDTARYSCFHCQGLRFLLPTEAIPIHPAPQTQTKTLQLPCHEAPQRSSFMHRRMNALVLPSLLVQCPSPIVLQLSMPAWTPQESPKSVNSAAFAANSYLRSATGYLLTACLETWRGTHANLNWGTFGPRSCPGVQMDSNAHT